jgi:hypothetical protein
MDAVKSIYSYLTGVPTSEHRLVEMGLRMEDDAVKTYIQNNSGRYFTTHEPLVRDHAVGFTRKFYTDARRSLDRYAIGVEPYGMGGNTTLRLTYRVDIDLGYIYISSTTRKASNARERNRPTAEMSPGFFIVRFVPSEAVNHVTTIPIPEFRHLQEGIRIALRRLSYANEEELAKAKKQLEALEEARPNIPQNAVRDIIGSFLVSEPTKKASSFFGEHSREGTRKRYGNVANLLNERLGTKRAARGGKRDGRKTRRNW